MAERWARCSRIWASISCSERARRYVQFTPDLLDKLTLTVRDKQIGGGYFLQEYRLAGGQAAGQYANGHIAAVEHTSGNGKTLLIGTFPGGSYYRNHSPATREFFAGLLAWAGSRPQSAVERPGSEGDGFIEGDGGDLPVGCESRREHRRTVKITLPGKFQQAADLWQKSSHPAVSGNTLTTTVEDRNAAVIRLK